MSLGETEHGISSFQPRQTQNSICNGTGAALNSGGRQTCQGLVWLSRERGIHQPSQIFSDFNNFSCFSSMIIRRFCHSRWIVEENLMTYTLRKQRLWRCSGWKRENARWIRKFIHSFDWDDDKTGCENICQYEWVSHIMSGQDGNLIDEIPERRERGRELLHSIWIIHLISLCWLFRCCKNDERIIDITKPYFG